MKRILLFVTIAIFTINAEAKRKPIEERPQDQITYSYKLRSNHSVSTTLLGLEYSFEGRVADRWTLIGRAGLVPNGFVLFSTPEQTSFIGNMGIGLTFETRWYSNIAKRAEYGRSTYNNSSDFISMRLRAMASDGELEISFTPAYGIRRTFGKLWFHEITFGPKIGIADGLFIAPHIQYRLGLTF